jgi:hypothetical protein
MPILAKPSSVFTTENRQHSFENNK